MKVQANIRRYIEQKKYEKAQAAVTQLQAAIRGHLARQEFKRINEALKKTQEELKAKLGRAKTKLAAVNQFSKEGEKAQAKREFEQQQLEAATIKVQAAVRKKIEQKKYKRSSRSSYESSSKY